MDESIFRRVAGTACRSAPAAVHGWMRRRMRGEVYPGIAPAPGGVVEGIVYLDLPPAAWARLDAFEGEVYERSRLGVRGEDGREREAFSYVVRPEFQHLLGDDDWSFDTFLSRDLHAFVRHFRGLRDP